LRLASLLLISLLSPASQPALPPSFCSVVRPRARCYFLPVNYNRSCSFPLVARTSRPATALPFLIVESACPTCRPADFLCLILHHYNSVCPGEYCCSSGALCFLLPLASCLLSLAPKLPPSSSHPCFSPNSRFQIPIIHPSFLPFMTRTIALPSFEWFYIILYYYYFCSHETPRDGRAITPCFLRASSCLCSATPASLLVPPRLFPPSFFPYHTSSSLLPPSLLITFLRPSSEILIPIIHAFVFSETIS
jgi:hypothetical protein